MITLDTKLPRASMRWALNNAIGYANMMAELLSGNKEQKPQVRAANIRSWKDQAVALQASLDELE